MPYLGCRKILLGKSVVAEVVGVVVVAPFAALLVVAVSAGAISLAPPRLFRRILGRMCVVPEEDMVR